MYPLPHRPLTSIGRNLCGSFEAGAPQPLIANSRRKEATTWWVCPCEMVNQWPLLGTNGGHWRWNKNVSGALGTKYVSEIVTRATKLLILFTIWLQECVTSISRHLSYAFFAFWNIIPIIMHTKHRPCTSNHLNNNMFCYKNPDPHFHRQMLALRVPFERGAPQSPIANSRRKKATTLWLCPWRMVSQWALLRHQWRPLGTAKKCCVSLGDKICIRNSNKYNTTVNYI